MHVHKFAIGARVHYRAAFPHQSHMTGEFTIEGQMPADTGGNQYRIASRADGHKRVAHETELSRPAKV